MCDHRVMNLPRVEEVILSREMRGTGKAFDPMRKILQVHTLDGELIAEEADELGNLKPESNND